MSARTWSLGALLAGACCLTSVGCGAAPAAAPQPKSQEVLAAPPSEAELVTRAGRAELSRAAHEPGKLRDLSRAQELARQALRIDPRFAPAFDLKARILLEQARDRAALDGVIQHHGLALAREACELGMKHDPGHAPLQLTAAHIALAQDDSAAALEALARARALDPAMYDALIGFADLSLAVLSLGPAEEAYRAARKLRPNDYVARLGLVRTLRVKLLTTDRGLSHAPFEQELAAVIGAADEAIAAAPARLEGLYERALVALQLETRAPGITPPKAEAALLRARELFARFVKAAESQPAFGAQRAQTALRIEEIDAIVAFNRLGEQERRKAEASP